LAKVLLGLSAPSLRLTTRRPAIDFFCVEEALQFRVVVEKLGRAETKERA
jgi:hypothetical protein